MINPIKDNILVELIDETPTIKSGIYIPCSVDTPLLAKVIKLGKCNKDPDDIEYPFTAKINDIVILEKNTEFDKIENNKKYKLVKEKDILLILK